jgi:hypothetical protein
VLEFRAPVPESPALRALPEEHPADDADAEGDQERRHRRARIDRSDRTP